jgi:hypothetical protein
LGLHDKFKHYIVWVMHRYACTYSIIIANWQVKCFSRHCKGLFIYTDTRFSNKHSLQIITVW